MAICITLPNWAISLLIASIFYVWGLATMLFIGWRAGEKWEVN